ncbi:MAG: TonB-dependent receptor domain-containing protein, partial [Fidelibacterota bacterium]
MRTIVKSGWFISLSMGVAFGRVSVQGVVENIRTGEPIVDANVVLEGTRLGAATDNLGRFVIGDIPEGEITVHVSAIGFAELRKTIHVTAGSPQPQLTFELTPSVIPLGPVTVLKRRSSLLGSSQNFLRVAGSASVIGKRDLIKGADTDIHRIIVQIPGVYVQEEDGYGLRANIGMRGTGVERSSKINMMEDGVLIAPAPYASPAAYYAPTAGRMEALEVRKGSSQIKYGPNTTGGALNYVSTSIPENFRLRGSFTGGKFGTNRAHMNLGSSGSHYGFLLEAFLDRTDGFKKLDFGGNTGYDKKDYLAKIRVNTAKDVRFPSALEVKYSVTDEISHETYLGLTEDDFGENPYRRYAASTLDQMDADHEQLAVTAVVQPRANLDITATYYDNYFHRNWYKLDEVSGVSIEDLLENPDSHPDIYRLLYADSSAADAYSIKANNRTYNSSGIQIVANSRFGMGAIKHSLMAGIRQHADEMDRYQKSDSYRMAGRKLVMSTEGVWGTGDGNNRLYEADATSFFLEDEAQIERLTLTGGFRWEDIQVVRTEWKGEKGEWDDPRRAGPQTVTSASFQVLVPGMGAVYEWSPSLSLLAGVHKGFAPPGPGTEQNTAKPEQSINTEIGVRYRKGFSFGEVIGFYNDYDNLLGSDTRFAGEGTYDQYNAGRVHIYGLELTGSYTFFLRSARVPVQFSATRTQAEFLSSFESEFDPWGDVQKGDELPYIPEKQLFARVGLETTQWNAN